MNCETCGVATSFGRFCPHCYIRLNTEECASLIHFMNHPGCNVASCDDFRKAEKRVEVFMREKYGK